MRLELIRPMLWSEKICECYYSYSPLLTLQSIVTSDGYNSKLFSAMELGLTYIFNFWHSGTLALMAERHSAWMSEIKSVG